MKVSTHFGTSDINNGLRLFFFYQCKLAMEFNHTIQIELCGLAMSFIRKHNIFQKDNSSENIFLKDFLSSIFTKLIILI